MKRILSAFILAAAFSGLAGVDGRTSLSDGPFVIFNEDSDNVWQPVWHADPGHYEVREFADYYSSIIDGGKITHLFFCVDARCSVFPSQVLPNYWRCLDDPAMESPSYLRQMHALIVERAFDPFALGIGLCRKKGVSPWLSFRMNDIHFPTDPKFFLNVGFWKEHPELWNDPKAREHQSRNWADYAFDYRREPVQELMLAYLKEALERYDVDGVELDWMRFEHHAPRAVARTEGAAALNRFMRRAQAVVEACAKRRGHAIRIAARVDSDPVSALNHGMDYRTWAKEGLIDWLIACNFWETVDFELPYASWAAELAALNPKVMLVPGLDCGVRLPGQKRRFLTPEEYAGWGDKMYRAGAKGVYVFNLFCEPVDSKRTKHASWDLVVKEGFTPEILARHAKAIPDGAPRECVINGWMGRP